MNGEIPSVPIITLAGVSSLTNVLLELQLPGALPQTISNKSLLYHPRLISDVQRILTTRNDTLVQQLCAALPKTNTDHIELNDGLSSGIVDSDGQPLLRAILAHNPNVFHSAYAGANTGYGFNVPQHGAVYPNSVRSTDDLMGSMQGYQQTPNGSFAGFGQPELPEHGGGYSQMQSYTAAEYACSLNGVNQNVQMHAKPATMGHISTKTLQTCSPAQAAPAPSVVPEQAHRDMFGATQYAASYGNVPLHDQRQLPFQHRGAVEKTGVQQPNLNKRPSIPKNINSERMPVPDMVPTVTLKRVDEMEGREHKKHHHGSYNVISSENSQKLTLKLTKNKDSNRGMKRQHSDDEDKEYDDGHVTTMAQMQEVYGEFAASLTERVKRRRNQNPLYRDDENSMDNDLSHPMSNSRGFDGSSRQHVDDADSDTSDAHEVSKPVKKEKSKHSSGRRLMDVRVCLEELMDSPTFKRFNLVVDSMLEAAEDIDLASIRDDDDEADGNSESVVTKSQMSDLCSEAAKLKSMGVINQLPCEKLVKTLTILQFAIRDGCKVIPAIDPDGDDDHLWRELAFERVLCALDASLIAMYIMTASGVPKEVFIEDVIERVVRLCKMQLCNAVYPEFDPVYRIDPHNKSGIQTNMKMKRAKSSGSKDRTVIAVYNKLTELTLLLSELVDIQELTDTIILQMSTLAVSPFFVENVSEVQLNSLKLVTCIFSRYEKHRQLILEDILSSLARLPSSKKNLRSYRLNADEQIQMVTALALQLIQCVVKLPVGSIDSQTSRDADDPNAKKKRAAEMVDREVMILTSYETAMRTAHNFLAVFLAKCTSKGEEDYRPLFENFVYDLLSTVNKPEWPAAELILSLLGNLLVKQFSSKSVDMSLRVASLDYLGIVAARLRKDAVSSQLNESIIDEIIQQMEDSKDGDIIDQKVDVKPLQLDRVSRTERLQKALLEYLAHSTDNDPSLVFVHQFYTAQWYRDCTMEAEKAAKKIGEEGAKKPPVVVNNKKKKKKRIIDSDDEEVDDDDDEDEDSDECKASRKVSEELDAVKEIQHKAEVRKAFLVQLMSNRARQFASFKSSGSKLDYKSALLVTRYLASNRPFSQSFDIYLTQILKVLCETAVAVRTKALKCLTAVIEADPAILVRTDMQGGVHGRFMDQSTSVREAAIELVGKFILVRPELTAQYYDMLSERILDTGISVRKRVIKIFRDICIEQPEFPKIPEMCVKMIRRVNDEEGIRKLVNETFQSMWFTAVKMSNKEQTHSRLLQRVMNITDVVAACRDSGFEWLEQLLDNLLRKEEDLREKPVEVACKQIVDCLVENVLQLEEKAAEFGRTTNPRLVACFSTLFLFCKVKPSLLMTHCITIQPYLDIKCTSQEDMVLLNNVTRILELAVPLMEHPSESFLAQLEEDMMKLILKHGMMIIQSCVSCLGAVINGVTHNYKLVKDCFQKFFSVLLKIQADLLNNPKSQFNRPTVLRALFTVGLLCKCFDFDSEEFGEKKVSIRDKVFNTLLYFLDYPEEEVQLKALTGLGFFVTRHYDYMLHKQLRDPYHRLLTSSDEPVKMCCQVLRNLQTYLVEEEVKMMKADSEWRKVHDKEDLKELGDVQSGMASTVIQLYLKQVLESFFHTQAQVRMSALEVVVLVLKQGLVHPIQCVPYLICMGSDSDTNIRMKADQQLQEIDKKYPGFIQMKAMQGIKMSYRLQELLHGSSNSSEPLRGMRIDDNNPMSLTSYVYSLIRGNKGQRRGLLTTILNMFDDTAKTPLNELIYMADNVAYYPYQLQDEPLFIMHQVDIIVSVSGSNLLQSYRELFYPSLKNDETTNVNIPAVNQEDDHINVARDTDDFFSNQDNPDNSTRDPNYPTSDLAGDPLYQPAGDPLDPIKVCGGTTVPVKSQQDEDDDEDIDSLMAILPDGSVQALRDLYLTSQGCVLLLVLKQHLKDTYGFTDSKIQRYSPTDSAKTFEKPVNRKTGVRFNPKQAQELVRSGMSRRSYEQDEHSEEDKRALIESYLDFKRLMILIDPDDPEDDDHATAHVGSVTVVNGSVVIATPHASRSVLVDPETGLPTSLHDSGDAVTPRRTHADGSHTTPHAHRPSSSAHRLPTTERRRGRPPGSHSLSSRSKLSVKSSASKPKKKKKRWNSDGSDSDDCNDPDWG